MRFALFEVENLVKMKPARFRFDDLNICDMTR